MCHKIHAHAHTYTKISIHICNYFLVTIMALISSVPFWLWLRLRTFPLKSMQNYFSLLEAELPYRSGPDFQAAPTVLISSKKIFLMAMGKQGIARSCQSSDSEGDWPTCKMKCSWGRGSWWLRFLMHQPAQVICTRLNLLLIEWRSVICLLNLYAFISGCGFKIYFNSMGV